MTVDLRRAATPQAGARVPPSNIDAEVAVLGALMLDRGAVAKVADFLHPDDFYFPNHGVIFQAAINLYEHSEPIDLLTLAAELEKKGQLDRVGGQEALAQLESSVPTAANIEYYAKIVEDAATKRRLTAAGDRIGNLAFEEGIAADVAVDKAEEIVFAVAERRIRQDFVPLIKVLQKTWEDIERSHQDPSHVSGVPSGFNDLDAKTGGFQKGNLIVIAARPGVGKCIAADSLIDDPVTGERVTIEDWIKERRPLVSSLRADGCIGPTSIAAWVDSGTKPCFTVTTQTGRRVTVTGHHPFLTVTGWQPLHDLVVGEAIAVPRGLPTFGTQAISLARARLLGYFIGDGGLTGGSPGFTNIDPAIIADFKHAVADEFPACHVRQDAITYFACAQRGIRGGNPITTWLRGLGLWGKYSTQKAFPQIAWTWDRRTLREFLKALMSCDGSIFATQNGRPRVEFAVASEQLANDVHHALVRFGIVARRYRKSERCWRVQITESESVARYQAEIGWIGEKAERFANEFRWYRSNQGHLPASVWKVVQAAAAARNLSWAALAVASGERVRTSRFETYNPRTNHGLSQRRLAIFNAVLQEPQLAKLTNAELLWDRIVSIEAVGDRHVYDLAVPDGENFVAEDIVVHNTSLVLNVAQHAAIHAKVGVGIFSMEMSETELATRMLCSEAGVDSYRLRRGLLKETEWEPIAKAMGALGEAPIFIEESPQLTVLEMRTRARRLMARENIGLIVVDYLQLMQGRNQENRVQEISDISRSLKGLARELNVPVIACSQLSREPEKRPDHRPQLADLRESGSIEQDSDVVLFIYRDRFYNDNLPEDKRNLAELIIAKHRNGPVGKIELLFVDEQTKFVNLDRRRGGSPTL